MAMMVHSNCRIGCCHPPTHGSVRQREKRATAAWRDDYESPASAELGDSGDDSCMVTWMFGVCLDADCDYPCGSCIERE